MIWIKIYTTADEILLAACDDDVLGETFEEGELQLAVSKSFYGGKKVTKEAFIGELGNATIANLVGKEVCKVALELGMIHESGIIEIAGVPHAQIAKLI
jgi:hypothetical protein